MFKVRSILLKAVFVSYIRLVTNSTIQSAVDHLKDESSKIPNVGVWIGKSHNMTKAGLILSGSQLGLLKTIDVIEGLLALPACARDFLKK